MVQTVSMHNPFVAYDLDVALGKNCHQYCLAGFGGKAQ